MARYFAFLVAYTLLQSAVFAQRNVVYEDYDDDGDTNRFQSNLLCPTIDKEVKNARVRRSTDGGLYVNYPEYPDNIYQPGPGVETEPGPTLEEAVFDDLDEKIGFRVNALTDRYWSKPKTSPNNPKLPYIILPKTARAPPPPPRPVKKNKFCGDLQICSSHQDCSVVGKACCKIPGMTASVCMKPLSWR